MSASGMKRVVIVGAGGSRLRRLEVLDGLNSGRGTTIVGRPLV